MLISKAQVRRMLKSQEKECSEEAITEINVKCWLMIKEAARRAELNGRKRVLERDV